MGLATGLILRNRYEIVRTVKKGGFGSVFEARDCRLAGTQCAVKEILDQALVGPHSEYVRKTFEKEMLALVGLSHPCIPRVRDFFEEGGQLYIVMDFVRGQSLEEEILDHVEQCGRGIPAGRAVADVLALLDTVGYLHRFKPPVLHRDIKPANILREEKTGQIKLVDFGLAKPQEMTTTPQSMVGTLGYSAAEQLSGLAEPRSDLFSVGATLYHMLTGKPPRMSFEPLSLDGSDPSLQRIVAKATQLSLDDRYSSADEMAADLRAWQSEISGPPQPQPSAVPPVRALTASPVAAESPGAGAWASVGTLAVGLGIVGWYSLARPAATPSVAVASPSPVLLPPGEKEPRKESTPIRSATPRKQSASHQPFGPVRHVRHPELSRLSSNTTESPLPPPGGATPVAMPRVDNDNPVPIRVVSRVRPARPLAQGRSPASPTTEATPTPTPRDSGDFVFKSERGIPGFSRRNGASTERLDFYVFRLDRALAPHIPALLLRGDAAALQATAQCLNRGQTADSWVLEGRGPDLNGAFYIAMRGPGRNGAYIVGPGFVYKYTVVPAVSTVDFAVLKRLFEQDAAFRQFTDTHRDPGGRPD